MTQCLIMEHVDVVLHYSIPSFEIKRVSLRLSIPTCEPKSAASSHDRHFSHGGENGIPPQQAQRAAIVFPFGEDEVHDHQQANFFLGRRSVNSLGLSDEFGSGLGAHGQCVVGHCYESEKRGGRSIGRVGFNHSNRAGIWAAENVVEEEVKVAQLLLLQSQRHGR